MSFSCPQEQKKQHIDSYRGIGVGQRDDWWKYFWHIYSNCGKVYLSALFPLASDGKLLFDNPSKVGTYDPSCDCYRGVSQGWRNFVKHFDLRRRNYLKNDDLIIFIDFEGKWSVFFVEWKYVHTNCQILWNLSTDITSLIKTEVPIKPMDWGLTISCFNVSSIDYIAVFCKKKSTCFTPTMFSPYADKSGAPSAALSKKKWSESWSNVAKLYQNYMHNLQSCK